MVQDHLIFRMQSLRSSRDKSAIRLSLAVRRERTLFGKVVQAMLEHPKCVRPIAQAFGLTTQNIYSIGNAFIDDLVWMPGTKGGRRPLLSPSEEMQICIEVDRLISTDQRPTFDELSAIVRRVRALHHQERIQRAEMLLGKKFILYALP